MLIVSCTCRGVAVRDEPEEFLAPLVLPTLPSRFYFRYGVGHEVRKTDSREHLEAVYQQVRCLLTLNTAAAPHCRAYPAPAAPASGSQALASTQSRTSWVATGLAVQCSPTACSASRRP